MTFDYIIALSAVTTEGVLILPYVKMGAAIILALVASYVLGFFWTHASIPREDGKANILGSKPLLVLLTSAGTGLLAKWNVENVGAIHGSAWICGSALGIVLTRAKLFRDYSAGIELLAPPDQREVKQLVRRSLFEEGRISTERKVSKKVTAIKNERSRMLLSAVEELHDFTHTSRDQAVKYLDAYNRLLADFVATGEWENYGAKLSAEFQVYLSEVLQCMIRMFEQLIGQPSQLWAAVRILDGEGSNRTYRTLLRVGKIKTNDRDHESIEIPEESGFPRFLRSQYERGNGIIVLPRNKRHSRNWVSTKNDEREEDASLMAGPIMIKSWDAEQKRVQREMFMILYMNSPKEALFHEGHRDYFRCCTDVLSLFFSMSAMNSSGQVVALQGE